MSVEVNADTAIIAGLAGSALKARTTTHRFGAWKEIMGKKTEEALDNMRFLDWRGIPYLQKKDLVKFTGFSRTTVKERVDEIEEISGKGKRYNEFAVLRDGNVVLVNVLVLVDYLKYRSDLRDSVAKFSVPPFDPSKIMSIMGWWNKEVVREA